MRDRPGEGLLVSVLATPAQMGLMVSTVSNVVLNLALIPPFGIEGAAAATGASIVIWNVLLVRQARRRLGIDTLAVRGLGG